MAESWRIYDEKGLAAFVDSQEVGKYFPHSINHLEISTRPYGRKKIVGLIYQSLVDKNISYALEAYNASNNIQLIRTPQEILVDQKKGTCLDLAILFGGLCILNELLPVLVILEDHALVAVSTKHGLRDWEALDRTEVSIFKKDIVRDIEQLKSKFEDETYIVVECTGFASSRALSSELPEGRDRNQQGFLSFEDAIKAGRSNFEPQQLQLRPFNFAIDIATAHHEWEMGPHFARLSKKNGPDIGTFIGHNLDRQPQVQQFTEGMKNHLSKNCSEPLVFIILAESSQAPDYLIDRFKKLELPAIYRDHRQYLQASDNPHELKLKKSTWHQLAQDEYSSVISESLLAAFTGNSKYVNNFQISDQDRKELVSQQLKNFFQEGRIPLFIRTPADLDVMLSPTFFKMVGNFLKFWREVRLNFVSERSIIIVICIEYKLANYNFFFRKIKKLVIGKRIRKLKKFLQRKSDGAECLVLPELENVTEEDINELVARPEFEYLADPIYIRSKMSGICDGNKGVSLLDVAEAIYISLAKINRGS